MLDNNLMEKYKLSKPIEGDRLTYKGKLTGTITRVEDSICYYERLCDGESELFIWAFHDGLNSLFGWSNKRETQTIISFCEQNNAQG